MCYISTTLTHLHIWTLFLVVLKKLDLLICYYIHKVSFVVQQEDRENVLRARESGKGVLTAPFPLLKTNRLGVILTFAVYKRDPPSNATPNERIQAIDG